MSTRAFVCAVSVVSLSLLALPACGEHRELQASSRPAAGNSAVVDTWNGGRLPTRGTPFEVTGYRVGDKARGDENLDYIDKHGDVDSSRMPEWLPVGNGDEGVVLGFVKTQEFYFGDSPAPIYNDAGVLVGRYTPDGPIIEEQ